jgi:signal transduction histidine kinase
MSMTPALIAFFGLGANVLGAVVLVLLNPRSRALRWYLPFQATIIFWLFALGMALATGDLSTWGVPHSVAVYLMPAFFIAFALTDERRAATPAQLVPIAVALVLSALLVSGPPYLFERRLLSLYHVGAWSIGGYLLWRRNITHRAPGHRSTREKRWLTAALTLFVPTAILSGMLVGRDFFVYFMPLVTVLILVLLFVGVVRHRFYDIEVRALRSGELAARATEQERLAVLGEIAASVAHEVRNPITGLQSLAQRLAEEDVDEARRRRYGALILDESRRLERIVSNLLALARRGDGRPEIRPRTLLPELFEDLRLLTDGVARAAGVELDMQAAAGEVAVPREALAQVLLNLLLNAIRHSPRGGRVAMSARLAEGGVLVAVTDEGPGVPPAERDRIFDAFHTGSGGTGLGLAVVRRIAEEHGWQLEVDDAPGGGAAFRILLSAVKHVPA